MTTTNKNTLSALSAENLLSAGFTAEDLKTIEKHGFSVGVLYVNEPHFFNIDIGGIFPLSAIRAEYEENREELKEDGIESFGEYVEYITAMGGSAYNTDHFFLPIVNGEAMPEQAEYEAECVIDGAVQFFGKPGNNVTILLVFCPAYEG